MNGSNDKDLENTEVFEKIIESLPEEQREVVNAELNRRRKATVRAAISQVMARNNSHNIGPYIGGKTD